MFKKFANIILKLLSNNVNVHLSIYLLSEKLSEKFREQKKLANKKLAIFNKFIYKNLKFFLYNIMKNKMKKLDINFAFIKIDINLS